MMKTKYFCASMMVVFFFLGSTRGSIAQSDTSQYAEVFFEDFESDLSQWNFPSPNLHGIVGAHMSVTGSESFEGSGSATFDTLIKGGSAFTDRIAVTSGSTYRLQIAHKGLVGTQRAGWVGFNLFSSSGDGSYVREKWMMGPKATDDFETVGAIKPEGFFDMVVFAPANNLIWDSADWGFYEASFTIPAGDVNYLSLKMEGTPDIFFDNVRLELIPEPSAALLALFGLSGLLVRRRC
jgi:hypothetical protein